MFKQPMRHSTRRGLTLIELMVAVAVLAILAMIAAPSFNNQLASSRVESAASELKAALDFARSEAIKQSSTVSVCPSTNGNTCVASSTDWAAGWLMWSDRNSIGVLDSGEPVIQTFGAVNSNVEMTGPGSVISFSSLGQVSSPGPFVILSSTQERRVCLSASGSSKIVKDSSC
jgi:type IV fimbrial biogenesis protein FimT